MINCQGQNQGIIPMSNIDAKTLLFDLEIWHWALTLVVILAFDLQIWTGNWGATYAFSKSWGNFSRDSCDLLVVLTWLDLIWPFRYCVRPNASTVPPNGEAIIKVMLQPGGTDERHKFMVQSIYGKFWPYLTSNDLMYKLSDDNHPQFYFSSPLCSLIWTRYHHFHLQNDNWKFWPYLTLFDLCILVPDDYNQIEEKDEKKNFVNSLWADSANNPVMSSKLICVFQTENQQTKSEVRI